MASAVDLVADDAGAGQTLLFIHGHPFNRSMWRPQVAEFSRDYRVITPDLRGYGASPLSEGVTTLEMHARDLVHLLDKKGVQTAVVCGLSMGGQIAMELCRLFPERVSAAVFAATFATADDSAAQERRRDMAERLLREGMSPYAREVLPKMMSPANVAALPAVAAAVLDMMEKTRPAGAAASLRGRALRPDYTNTLATLRVPALVVLGTQDAYTTRVDAEHMKTHLPRGWLVIIDQAGHMPNLERPEAFKVAMRDFLTRECNFA
jgi:pimeloyl-ACP methyl ester carboxylesterase